MPRLHESLRALEEELGSYNDFSAGGEGKTDMLIDLRMGQVKTSRDWWVGDKEISQFLGIVPDF